MIDLAKQYAEKELTVLPAQGKAVLVPGWSNLTYNEMFNENYSTYWGRSTGIGLLCGPTNGIICVDIDLDIIDDAKLIELIRAELPPIYCGKRGNPNRPASQFFKYSGESADKFKNIHVEILSTGNQTIIPPSKHPDFSGVLYQWEGNSLLDIDIDELPTLPTKFLNKMFELNNAFKINGFSDESKDKTIRPAKGRCNHNSHTRLSELGVALIHNNYDFDMLVKRLLDEDRKINSNADYLYFECPSRPWEMGSSKLNNAKIFVDEIYRNHGPGGKKSGKLGKDKNDAEQKKKPGNYEQVGFYYRYKVPKDDGGVKIVDVPQYDLMAEHCFDNNLFCFDDSISLKWNEKYWQWFSKIAFDSFILDKNKECLKPFHISNFQKFIKAQCFIDNMEVAQPNGLINVNNGVIDARSGELMPHSHKHLFRSCSEVDFKPGVDCPKWLEFLNEVFIGDQQLIKLAQLMFGYIIIGGRPFLHKAFVLYGSGRNGKSTFMEVLSAVIGENAYSTVSLSNLHKEFSVVSIDGKLANMVEETPNDEINSEAFKNLVAGGRVQAAHKGFDEYTFRCDARFIFACNDLPKFKDKNNSMLDRLVFVPFTRYFEEIERDVEIVDKLLGELSGIYNWALEGAKEILETKKLPSVDAVNKTKEEYRQETDNVYAWYKNSIEITQEVNKISSDKLYRKYKFSITEDGQFPLSKRKFLKSLRDLIIIDYKANNLPFNRDYTFEETSTYHVGKEKVENTRRVKGYRNVLYKN